MAGAGARCREQGRGFQFEQQCLPQIRANSAAECCASSPCQAGHPDDLRFVGRIARAEVSFLVASFQCQSSTWFDSSARTAACRAGSRPIASASDLLRGTERLRQQRRGLRHVELLQQRGDIGPQRRRRRCRASPAAGRSTSGSHLRGGGDEALRGVRDRFLSPVLRASRLTPTWPVAARSLRAMVRTSADGSVNCATSAAIRCGSFAGGGRGGHAGVGELGAGRAQAPWRGPVAACCASRIRSTSAARWASVSCSFASSSRIGLASSGRPRSMSQPDGLEVIGRRFARQFQRGAHGGIGFERRCRRRFGTRRGGGVAAATAAGAELKQRRRRAGDQSDACLQDANHGASSRSMCIGHRM